MWLLGVFWKQPSKQWPQLCTLTLKGGLSTTYEHSVWLDPAWSYARQSDQSRSKPKFLHTQVSRGLCLSHLVPRTSEHCVWLDRWSYPMPDKAAQNQLYQICWATHGRERRVSLCWYDSTIFAWLFVQATMVLNRTVPSSLHPSQWERWARACLFVQAQWYHTAIITLLLVRADDGT